jgi:hypothetical protein
MGGQWPPDRRMNNDFLAARAQRRSEIGRDLSPQRSGECEVNEYAHEELGNLFMVAHPPPIRLDRPEMFYRLQVVFPNELFS